MPSTLNQTRLIDLNLRLGGVTCVACTDLIERDLKTQSGVQTISASYTLRRTFLSIDPSLISAQTVIERIEKLGYHAYQEQIVSVSDSEKLQNRREFFRLLVALLLLMQSMMFMYPFYTGGESEMSPEIASLMRWANLILTLPIMFYCATPLFKGALAEIRLRRLGMDTPVVFAIIVAFVASLYATLAGEGHIYYDSITMFVALLLSARYLQFKALNKASSYLSQVWQHKRLFSEKVVDYPNSKTITLIPATELLVGDVVFIASGETIPADAVVIDGQTTCSQALITGESLPIKKSVGDSLLAGSTNIEQAIYARITTARGESELDEIERLVQKSALHKPALAKIAEVAARYFLYGLLLVCAAAAVYWWMVDASRVVPIVVAILIITCPCALALAIPTVLTAASSALARQHVLVVNPEALTQLARVNVFAFDKTGTLTQDVQILQKMSITSLAKETGWSQNELLQIAATLEAASRHPIALALRKALQDTGLSERMDDVSTLELVVGQGVLGTFGLQTFRVGKPSFAMQRELLDDEVPDEVQGCSVAVLADDSGALAWFTLNDETRPHAASLISSLQRHCVVQLISGDKTDVVMPFAEQLNISVAHANVSPADKLNLVQNLQKTGHIVAMTGDGLNDAAVLQQADVAIAMGHGSSLTQMQADLIVQSGSLNDIYAAHVIARRARRLMYQNLIWALAYNLVAIPLAAMGHVTPLVASIGMAASSLIVVTNALRVLRPVPTLG